MLYGIAGARRLLYALAFTRVCLLYTFGTFGAFYSAAHGEDVG